MYFSALVAPITTTLLLITLYLFRLTVLLNPSFNCFTNLTFYSANKVTLET